MEKQTQFDEYINLECLIEKAILLKEIKESTKLPYVLLAEELYEDSRTLKRVYKINRLIPEYQELVREGRVSKVVAYHISGLTSEKQKQIYEIFKDRLIRWNTKKQQKKILSEIKSVEDDYNMDSNILMNLISRKYDNKSIGLANFFQYDELLNKENDQISFVLENKSSEDDNFFEYDELLDK